MGDPVEHITCAELVELVSDYLESSLSADQASLFEQHLLFCDGCVNYTDQLRLTVAATGRLRKEDLPEETRARLLTAFRDWKRS
jgi:hypothetical protein